MPAVLAVSYILDNISVLVDMLIKCILNTVIELRYLHKLDKLKKSHAIGFAVIIYTEVFREKLLFIKALDLKGRSIEHGRSGGHTVAVAAPVLTIIIPKPEAVSIAEHIFVSANRNGIIIAVIKALVSVIELIFQRRLSRHTPVSV